MPDEVERWLDWAVDDPAPAANCGYGFLNIPGELADPSLRRGVVIHSSEGYWSASYRPSDTMKARGNSWGASIMQDGAVYRHRPRPTFVNWHAGGPAQNIGTDGIEMEGKEPWMAAQKVSLVRVLKETQAWFGWPPYSVGGPTDRTQEGIRQALLAQPYGTLWEHRWAGFTACPRSRSEFNWLIPALLEPEEEEMDEATIRKIVLGMIADNNNSAERFKQIADNLPELNNHLSGVIEGHVAGLINAHYGERPHLTIQQIRENYGPHEAQVAGALTLAQLAKALEALTLKMVVI